MTRHGRASDELFFTCVHYVYVDFGDFNCKMFDMILIILNIDK